jgi:hypothetical protein
LQVSSEVTVQQGDGTDLIAISREARTPGEMLIIELVDGSTHVHTPVRVADSRPIIVAGSVRHRVSLIRIAQAH